MNAMSVLATKTLLKIMASKRFVKAVERSETIPQNLLKALRDTMQSAKDMGMTVPSELQAQALHFAHGSKE